MLEEDPYPGHIFVFARVYGSSSRQFRLQQHVISVPRELLKVPRRGLAQGHPIVDAESLAVGVLEVNRKQDAAAIREGDQAGVAPRKLLNYVRAGNYNIDLLEPGILYRDGEPVGPSGTNGVAPGKGAE